MDQTNMLTTNEAKKLIQMIKTLLTDAVDFPDRGCETVLNAVGDNKEDTFLINIWRPKINRTKYNFIARIKKNGMLLLELHVNPSGPHKNPDNELIVGTHWHVYTEEYGMRQAFLADGITDDEFINNTLKFFVKFGIVNKPVINLQLEIL